MPCTHPASAESLRCNGYSASEGDSRISVLYKCGQPLLRDIYCSPVYYSQTLQPVPEPFASAFVPCQPVEEWLYERGPGPTHRDRPVPRGGRAIDSVRS